ncbi:MAG: hypothetical protein H7A23_14740 [Leptospiraceae bacterium]|nr:hypothetical protein [Leptospiraceae bacterium]MCP5495807.1 hypothetical protein [Leptospiraceae bacterium]
MAVILLFVSHSLKADVFHNIKGFYGLRASGMGGAFTAISDDPSGAIYNPAGLGFMPYNKMTISSVSYQFSSKVAKRINGYDRDYNIKSSGLSPNFIGSAMSFGKLRFSFSILSPTTNNYDQTDQVYNPINIPFISQLSFGFTESNSNYQFGPTLAYLISDRFSIGATILGFLDESRNSEKLLIRQKSGAYINQTSDLRQETRGLKPILGFQFMPSPKWSFGFSMQRIFLLSKKIRFTQVTTSQDVNNERLINVLDENEKNYGEIIGITEVNDRLPDNVYFLGNNTFAGEIPENYEFRFGVARFISDKFLMAFDTIYTTSYNYKKDILNYDPFSNIAFYRGNEYMDLHYLPTINFSLGIEYFFTPNIAIRLGTFTNKSNSKRISWIDSFLDNGIRENLERSSQLPVITESGILIYNLTNIQAPARNEYVNLRGLSLGVAWETDTSALGITYIYETGLGQSVYVDLIPSTELEYNESKFYFTSTIRN